VLHRDRRPSKPSYLPACLQCPDFHTMLQSIYQAGYQQGVAAAQQAQQAAQQYVLPVTASTPLQYS
jgi:hypothetical protein